MESCRFDSFARALTAEDSRRGAARTLAATGLALGLARLGVSGLAAKKGKNNGTRKKPLGERCKKSKQCQGSLVCQLTDDHNNCGYDPAARRCCKKLGDTCNSSCECCGTSVICNGHICETA